MTGGPQARVVAAALVVGLWAAAAPVAAWPAEGVDPEELEDFENRQGGYEGWDDLVAEIDPDVVDDAGEETDDPESPGWEHGPAIADPDTVSPDGVNGVGGGDRTAPRPAAEDGGSGSSPWSMLLVVVAVLGLIATRIWVRREREREEKEEEAEPAARSGEADDDTAGTRAWADRRPGSGEASSDGWDPAYDDYVAGAQLVDAALRAAAAGSPGRGVPRLHWVESSADDVRLVPVAPATPPTGFVRDGMRGWRVSASWERLAALGRGQAPPVPLLVPVGALDEEAEAELLIDLQAAGVVVVEGRAEAARALVWGLALAAAASPWRGEAEVVLVGMTGTLTDLPWVTSVADMTEGLAVVGRHVERSDAPVLLVSAALPDGADVPGAGDQRQVRRLRALLDTGLVVVSTAWAGAPHLPSGRTLTLGDDGSMEVEGVATPAWPRLVSDDNAEGLLVPMPIGRTGR